jgi:hypothetical protein
MRKKGSERQKEVKKTAAQKVTKKKRVSAGKDKAKTEKGGKALKAVKKETKKLRVRVKKKKAVKKEFKEIKLEKKEKAKKKVAKEVGKKVETKKTTKEPVEGIKAKEVTLPKKAVPKITKKSLLPERKEKYPPLPIKTLHEEYGEDSIALMIVDPRKLFIYWEVKEDTCRKFIGNLNVRLYNFTSISFEGMNSSSYFDIVTNDRIGSLYIDVSPEREFIADIGFIDPAGFFITVARSNKVSTPRAEAVEEGVLPSRLYETGLPIRPKGYEK